MLMNNQQELILKKIIILTQIVTQDVDHVHKEEMKQIIIVIHVN